jgi:hypothetical protein
VPCGALKERQAPLAVLPPFDLITTRRREIEDNTKLLIELDVIDKNQDRNRLTSPPQADSLNDSMKNADYINGPGIRQQF